MAETSTTVQKVSAEALGTFVLVFFGCGTAIFTGGSDYVAIGLAFGLTVLFGAYAVRPDLGRPLQPGRLGRRRAGRPDGLAPGARSTSARSSAAPSSPASRCSSWSRASTATTSATRDWARTASATTAPATPGGRRSCSSCILTAVFVWVILAVTDARNEHPALAPAAIGLTLTMIHFVVDPGHRHLGQPGPLDRRRPLRRQRRDHPALAVHPRPARSAARSRGSPTRCCSATAPTRCPAPG